MVKFQETTFAIKFRPVVNIHEVVDFDKQTFFTYLCKNSYRQKHKSNNNHDKYYV